MVEKRARDIVREMSLADAGLTILTPPKAERIASDAVRLVRVLVTLT